MNVTTKLNKLCQIADFEAIRPYMQELQAVPEPGKEHRKQWEVAMAICTFAECVAPTAPLRTLGVGAGNEITLYWLTRHSEVHVTDLYADAGTWDDTAPLAMLKDPASTCSHLEWNPRRLIVQHMDGRDLRYEDDSFDFVFSSSSIEHFGEFGDVATSMREIGRVLKPGGIVSLSTEFKLAGPGGGFHNVLTLDTDDLCALIEASGLRMIDDLDLTPDPGLTASFQKVFEDIADFGTPQEFPHIKLEFHGYEWTSVHLALRKPLNTHDHNGITVAQWRDNHGLHQPIQAAKFAKTMLPGALAARAAG